MFPVRLIHKDKIAREIPRTKLQHHISREVRGIGFFNEMMKRSVQTSMGRAVSRTIARTGQMIARAIDRARYGRKSATWEDFFRKRGNCSRFYNTLIFDREKLKSSSLRSMAWRSIVEEESRLMTGLINLSHRPYKRNVLGYRLVYHKDRLIAQAKLRLTGKGASTTVTEIPTYVDRAYCSDPRGEGSLEVP